MYVSGVTGKKADILIKTFVSFHHIPTVSLYIYIE
jgi:hypothetical protein